MIFCLFVFSSHKSYMQTQTNNVDLLTGTVHVSKYGISCYLCAVELCCCLKLLKCINALEEMFLHNHEHTHCSLFRLNTILLMEML